VLLLALVLLFMKAAGGDVLQTTPSLNKAVLIVLVHGNNGASEDWDPFVESSRRNTWLGSSKDVFFFASRANEGKKTLVGVEVAAQRLVDEVTEFLASSLSSFDSIALYMISHSLGGLITRCSLPSLFAKHPQLVPVGWISIARQAQQNNHF
jgi:triacylglycerol esterase/lipase EstA (alpha/beta hydrolase family)